MFNKILNYTDIRIEQSKKDIEINRRLSEHGCFEVLWEYRKLKDEANLIQLVRFKNSGIFEKHIIVSKNIEEIKMEQERILEILDKKRDPCIFLQKKYEI